MPTINFRKSRILIVAAHPDDEILGCGATLAEYNPEDVLICILGEGSTCRIGAGEKEIRERRDAANNALKMLELDSASISFYDAPCGNFQIYDRLELTRNIESCIRYVKPNIVFTHFPGDTNLDHRVVYDVTRIATRPYLESTIEAVLMYEVPSSTDRSNFVPNVYVHLQNESIERKCRAMEQYSTEMNHKQRGPDGLMTLANLRGLQCGTDFAESFMLERMSVKW